MLGSAGKVSGSSMEDTAKSIKSIDERLSKVEKSASRGPVRAVVKAVLPQQDENLVKAAAYREKAATSTDPSLVKGYLALAADLEKNG
jgi:hypothetical protein